jgi:hypothetical protein
MSIKLPLRDGDDWEMPPSFEMELNDHFMDVQTELSKARLWLLANPHRRKTKRGIRTFCLNWLNRAGKIRPAIAKPVSLVRIEAPINREEGREKLAQLRALIHR